jgi:uncharacterized RDD family membrane protein YckC
MNESLSAPSPGLPRRLVALLYDILLVLPLIMLSVLICMGIRTVVTGDGAGELGTPVLHRALVQSVAWITGAAFFWSFWLKGGQTLGMQAWRIRLVAEDGGPPGLRQACLRSIGATFSAACLGAGYWWSLLDRDNRYWHDYFSGTRLILLPGKDRKKSKKPG